MKYYKDEVYKIGGMRSIVKEEYNQSVILFLIKKFLATIILTIIAAIMLAVTK